MTPRSLASAIIDQQVDWRLANTGESRYFVQSAIDLSHRFVIALQADPLVRASIRLTLERNTFVTDDASPYQGWVSSVFALFSSAQDAGELKPDVVPLDAAKVLVSAITGAQLLSEALDGRRDLAEQIHQVWKLVLPGLVTPRLRRRLLIAPA